MRPIRLSLIPSFAALLMTGGASYAATPGDLEGNPAAVKSNLMQLGLQTAVTPRKIRSGAAPRVPARPKPGDITAIGR